MTLFVDTSVWSLALRRDGDVMSPEVQALRHAIEGGDIVVVILIAAHREIVDQAGEGPQPLQRIFDAGGPVAI